MTLRARPWRGWQDLAPMQRLLARSLLTEHPSAYIHPGDLAWWLGWPPKSDAWLAANVVLWEDDAGTLRAWLMLDGDDVGEWVDTDDWRDPEASWAAVDGWLSERPGLRRYVRDDDADHIARLEADGYRRLGDDLVGSRMDLEAFATVSQEPSVRPLEDPSDVPARATITRSAFESFDRPYDTYLGQYRAFIASPAYPRGWDLIGWAAPGRAAACTIAWPDAMSGVGNFEPVATHPAYHRQGYGSAVLREGCRRLAAAGMRRALVRTGMDNAPAIALYRAVGFEDDHVELTFRRS